MRHLAPPRTAAALLLCCSLLLAASAAVLGLAPSARAEDSLGKLTFPVTSGKTADNPGFPEVTTDGPCPSTNAQQVSLVVANPSGGTITLGKTTVGAPFDQGPFTAGILAGKSLESVLRGWTPTGSLDGAYDIRLMCRTAANVGGKYFAAKVQVTGDSWTLEAPVAAGTTTALTAAPAATAPVGAEVTLTAAVTPAAAAGKVTFLDGATALGTVDAASGTAVLRTTALAQGAHTLTASFAPADTAAYAASVSTAAAYTVTAAGSPSPDPSDTGSPTPTAPTDLDATDADGTALDVNPTLTAGQKVLLTARGYTKDAKVKVALADSEATFPDATADAQGAVTAYAFTVPADSEDGSYTLSLTEDKADGHSVEFMYSIGDAPGPDPDPSDSATADDGGTTDGTDGGDSGAADTGGGDGSTGGGETATGPLASTGTSALALGAAALALCGLGTAFVMHARRKGLLQF
ncbi:Ig-like domain-containing protein [Streptomyces sp. NBC_00385]|uniref:Ig-like domain-containing protein n=1 Tax=Streptomyces sp. NBC_00385 TaxID=2975733 RepID=UPI002DD9CAE9|nr:Ig-like domain-containing protein [Streptomyces sp. NBC_00385]WRZ04283.1 Ig-like domain-containing protein [Streptomyces sp. NBC_00385]